MPTGSAAQVEEKHSDTIEPMSENRSLKFEELASKVCIRLKPSSTQVCRRCGAGFAPLFRRDCIRVQQSARHFLRSGPEFGFAQPFRSAARKSRSWNRV